MLRSVGSGAEREAAADAAAEAAFAARGGRETETTRPEGRAAFVPLPEA
jgi:hypothetical protein